jgi:Anticodon binding domain
VLSGFGGLGSHTSLSARGGLPVRVRFAAACAEKRTRPRVGRDGGWPRALIGLGYGDLPSYTRPEDARAISYERLDRRLSAAAPGELAAIRRILRTYDAADGTRQPVMMIHRGTVGSMERVTAALLEHYQGRLPLWLAPVQVGVLPVGAEHDAVARQLVDDLIAAGLRTRLDTAGSVGARVRSSRQRRDHLIAVVGDSEVAGDSVQVTDIAGGFRGSVKAAEFTGLVRGAYENRMPQVAWEPAG